VSSAGQVPSSDTLAVIVREVFSAPEYRWGSRADPLSKLRELWWRTVQGLRGLEDTHPVIYWLLIAVLSVVLVALLVHVTYLLWRALRVRQTSPEGTATASPARDAAWFLAGAREAAAHGRFADALGLRFLALMRQLDRVEAVRFHASKTPAEYVSEARMDAAGREELGRLVAALYQYLFAGRRCAADDWARFDADAEEVARHVAPA